MSSTNCNTAALLLFITAVFVSIIVGSVSYVSTTLLLYISAIFILIFLGGGFISIINSMLILVFVGVLIFALGHSKSFMDKKIGGSTYFTRWSVSHFMLYLVWQYYNRHISHSLRLRQLVAYLYNKIIYTYGHLFVPVKCDCINI